MKLFKLTENTKIKYGRTLTQIAAVVDFKDVSTDDLGGWVEDEQSIRDDCWVYQDGEVYKNATMRGGVMRGGVMYGGVMYGGVMRGGVMRGGVMYDGEMHGGEMRGGEMRGGVMHGSVMRGGVMRGGEMHGGVMYGGVMCGGEMRDDNHIGFANVGSERGYLLAYIIEGVIMISRGCFHGSIDEFYDAVGMTHGDNEHAEFYKMLRPIIEAKLKDFTK